MTEEKKQRILDELKERYEFDERGLFGVQPLQNYIKRNNLVIADAIEKIRVGGFHYKRKQGVIYLYYRIYSCNIGMLFASVKRTDFSTILMRRIMEYLNTFNGITSWKGFVETTKILDKDYLERHPNALFRWATKEEIDGLVDAVWDTVYEKLDMADVYLSEADAYISSRREKERI